ncbi:hypothetical protein [Zavarzinia sp. CC-PAN008]|uniref:hypothetical protein n=1 Tax=Zavarzinia sp. CC-PAN008 TaxID=3243332 RepID=UPI003F746CD7
MRILIHPLLQGAVLLLIGGIMLVGGEDAAAWNAGVLFFCLLAFGILAPLSALAAPAFGTHMQNATAVWLWLAFLLTIAALYAMGYDQIGNALAQPLGFIEGAAVFPLMAMVALLIRPFVRARPVATASSPAPRLDEDRSADP